MYERNLNKTKSRHIAYRPDVDGLRAIAIILVVAYHAFPKIITGGFVGVDVFFVISGYLITLTILQDLKRESFSLWLFYGRRFRRIGPALICMLVAISFLGWLTLSGIDFIHFGKHLMVGALFVSNFLLRKEAGYFDVAAENKPLLHLWSLSVEEQFYLLWPLTLVVLYKNKKYLVQGVTFLLFCSLALNIWVTKDHPNTSFYMLPTRFWELLMGCLFAILESAKSAKMRSPTVSNFLSIVGLTLIVFAALILNKQSSFPGCWAILPTMGAFLIISSGETNKVNEVLLANRPMVFIGLISYPLYLWHWPLLSLSRTYFDEGVSALILLTMVAAAFILSALTYQYLEKPVKAFFRFNSTKGVTSPKAAVSLACLCLLTLAGLGLSVNREKLVSRFAALNPMATELEKQAEYDLSATRFGKCFIDTGQPFRAFEPICYKRDSESQKPTLMLLGDSHGAHLYPGIESFFRPMGFNIVQLNASSCPPLILSDSSSVATCIQANKFIFDQLKKQKPDLLILSSSWLAVVTDKKNFSQDFLVTMKTYAEAGAKKVAVVGPSPTWTTNLPKIIEKHFLGKGLPWAARVKIDLDPRIFEADENLRELAKKSGVQYISLTGALCTEEGCLVGNSPRDLMVYDGEHLTLSGSKFVVENIVGPQIERSLK